MHKELRSFHPTWLVFCLSCPTDNYTKSMHKNENYANDSHRYKDQLAKVERAANHTNMASGFGLGLIFAMIYTGSALILWYGSKLVRENDAYAPGDVFVVSFYAP